jgi:hypothetical protein
MTCLSPLFPVSLVIQASYAWLPASAPDNREAETRALRERKVAALSNAKLILRMPPIIVGRSGIQALMKEAFTDRTGR